MSDDPPAGSPDNLYRGLIVVSLLLCGLATYSMSWSRSFEVGPSCPGDSVKGWNPDAMPLFTSTSGSAHAGSSMNITDNYFGVRGVANLHVSRKTTHREGFAMINCF